MFHVCVQFRDISETDDCTREDISLKFEVDMMLYYLLFNDVPFCRTVILALILLVTHFSLLHISGRRVLLCNSFVM